MVGTGAEGTDGAAGPEGAAGTAGGGAAAGAEDSDGLVPAEPAGSETGKWQATN